MIFVGGLFTITAKLDFKRVGVSVYVSYKLAYFQSVFKNLNQVYQKQLFKGYKMVDSI